MIDPAEQGTYVRLDALRVGVVDDSAYFRKLAETMLGAFGVRVILQAATEAEALTMVMTQSPDVLLLDWNLGTAGNGAAFLDLLRRHPDDRVSTLAVVMVTAYADKRRMLTAVELGANDVLIKPLSARRLYERLADLSSVRQLYARRGNRLVPAVPPAKVIYEGPSEIIRVHSPLRGKPR
ncbi:response regulator [Pleomorphomonas koreensis]|uniref:response regulator n=1 Tax=Pleomorphomonas koreensis TaxID=257440 RepID=UPI00047A2395|nr:response regulator [Pleomorphomonas koreensis]